jgi:hypothetical protein
MSEAAASSPSPPVIGLGRLLARETVPEISARSSLESSLWDSSGTHVVKKKNKNPRFPGVLGADDGTRTHDLLHGKGWRVFASVRTRSPKPLVCSDFEGTSERRQPSSNVEGGEYWRSDHVPLAAVVRTTSQSHPRSIIPNLVTSRRHNAKRRPVAVRRSEGGRSRCAGRAAPRQSRLPRRQPEQTMLVSEIATVISPLGVTVTWKTICMVKLS